jgi:hypothetical protein
VATQANDRRTSLQAEFKRKQELAMKPEKLEEAIEKLIKWRIESEKMKVRETYINEVDALKTEIAALKGIAEAQTKKGKK